VSEVELRGVRKRFGALEVIRGIDLQVEKGEFLALLGPSGCGKSTLLRMIAGLEPVTAGAVFVDGVDMTNVPPAKRGMAMVFQSYALYPHMSVARNISFGLSVAGADKEFIQKRTAEVARTLQLEPLLDRRPAQLSGGQRQRVAIGRTLVRNPKVFLFDEPLSNLDAMLRTQMRVELAKLHGELAATMIYVTHDQVEAMTLSDRIVVLDRGDVSQVGAPMELYERPRNRFVASFIGSPTMNFVAGEARATESGTAFGLAGGKEVCRRNGEAKIGGGPIEIGIRPEHVRLVASGDTSASLPGIVQILERLGNTTLIYADTPAGQIVVQAGGDATAKTGDHIGLSFDATRSHVFVDGLAIA
jgi:multiple sugar transport system ATP-binding protein